MSSFQSDSSTQTFRRSAKQTATLLADAVLRFQRLVRKKDHREARYIHRNPVRRGVPGPTSSWKGWDAKPASVPYASFGDPQTLNLYAYVENAPVNKVDADGHAAGNSGAQTQMYQFNDEDTFSCTMRQGSACTGDEMQGYANTSYESSAAQKNQNAQAMQASNGAQQQDVPGQAIVDSTKQAAMTILSGANNCASYFWAGALRFTGSALANPAAMLESDDVQAVPNSSYTSIGAHTTQRTGAGSTIAVNMNSPFVWPVDPRNGGFLPVGHSASASPTGRVGMLLHELAHTLTMIPRDGSDKEQSHRNTQTIMNACEADIKRHFALQP